MYILRCETLADFLALASAKQEGCPPVEVPSDPSLQLDRLVDYKSCFVLFSEWHLRSLSMYSTVSLHFIYVV